MNRSDRTTILALVLVLIAATFTIILGTPGSQCDSIALLQVDGMTCGSCSGKINDALKRQPGVGDITVDIQSAIVEVQFDSTRITPGNLSGTISSLGFPSSVAYAQKMKSGPASTGNNRTGCRPSGCKDCNKNIN